MGAKIMNVFLQAMIKKWGRDNGLTPHSISFYVAPKINSVYRLNDAALKEQMFYAFADEADIDDTIKLLGRCHRQQSDTARQLYQDIQANLRCYRNFVIGVIPTEYKAYTGLVASKLADRYSKPAIVLREVNPTLWSGSFRSPVPLLSIINTSGIAQAQGHESSAGIVVKKADLGQFCQWLDEQQIDTTGDIEVAACLDVADITLELCEQIEQCGHLWGKDLSHPLMFVEFDTSKYQSLFCGKNNNTFKFGCFIKFSCNENEVQIITNNDCKVQAIVELGVNQYNGNKYPQAKIVEWEINPQVSLPEEIRWEDIFT